MIENIGQVLTLFAVAILGIAFLRNVDKRIKRVRDYFLSTSQEVHQNELSTHARDPIVPHYDAVEPMDEPLKSANEPNEPQELSITLEELRMLNHAITLHNQGGGKIYALETAFRCKKGGSKAYKRATELFNAATGGNKQ
jgi:hypothetical protein